MNKVSSNLVIVESAAKAKTIKKYLGKNFEVIACVGHIRDLPPKRIGVDVNNNFEPKYVTIKSKKEIIDKLKEKKTKSSKIFLATDPDREGEAISWHLAHVLKLDLEEENRITFNEITKFGIKTGMDSPRKIDISLVDAQQTRRILDRLVGYKLSPFLCKCIQKGVSGGRVQSVALKVIIEQEEKIKNFKPQEYWTIEAHLLPVTEQKNNKKIVALFYGKKQNGKKEKMSLNNKDETDGVLEELKNKEYKIESIKRGTKNKNPSPPFLTSTLQQDASRKLGFTARKTMKIAQELYEGVEINNHATGLITYMRTDSLRVSKEAIDEVRKLILEKWGDKYLPEKERVFKTSKKSQDGHEAIRPTSTNFIPKEIKKDLTLDQYKLYNLIWQRFVSSQMSACVYSTIKIEIIASIFVFNAIGSQIKFDGFTILYTEGKDDEENNDDKNEILPFFKEGTICNLEKILPVQHFTEPPPRFNEASLIKFLEENNIGRPSTYAQTISNITYREYVLKEGKTFVPTELGCAVNNLLKKFFPEIIDIKFTAEMEKNLDSVETNKQDRISILNDFYWDFEKKINEATEKTKDLKIELKENQTDLICEKCGEKMVIRRGRFGKFIACSGYPECKNIKKKVDKIGVSCPKCGDEIIKKSSSKGRIFYGCQNYPNCDFVSWLLPTNNLCPNCKKNLYVSGKMMVCKDSECEYKQQI